ncbi:hypothetical protein P3342_005011 [Pyrenophora teres f. teres]|uniref:Uncharacterized protein n=1 Tax=Pyrenophora teres f. teres TaxID=97479 RepID=A0A6S6VT96_9PLEO|nr:hypothetical protein HRS9139_00971 [Pyrenophora teres f. teres]KAE8868469.1 hypothetical protein PTNB29_02380 [Pyrenophora teres f. teres]KAE8873235.1 hypothetical protein PTNB73_02386 [Pyrenophora teres f. teres]KAK1913075.1 hypothetical protein P3342_005011 [Pyrenophora teres f. teres]CAE7022266.1 hypothetical protein PTTW11_03402 [Pyrenophora teres f. teres]
MRFSLLVPAVLLALGNGAQAIVYGCICKDEQYGADREFTHEICKAFGVLLVDVPQFYQWGKYQCKFDNPRVPIDPATWDKVCRRGNKGQGNVLNKGGVVGQWSGWCNAAV